MAKMTIGQKAARVLDFMMGLRNARVAQALASHGFTDEDLGEGFGLLKALTSGRLKNVAVVNDPKLLLLLDAWENKWFPIVEAVLKNRFPDVHATVFLNLTQTEGAAVLVSVSTLIDRLEAMPTTGVHAEARAVLERRRFTQAVIDEAKEILTALGKIERPTGPSITPEQEAENERRLWAWYLEWSAIARSAISDRRALRAMGFLNDRGTPVPDPEEDDVVDDLAAPNGPPTPAGPGLPGGDPFGGGGPP